jgi:exodeoxyribonuclease VII large subunit
MTLDAARDALRTLSPAATLERGYAVARLDDGAILRDASRAQPGEALHVVLARGTVDTTVTGARTDGAEELLR